jgi:hypothetical protein
VTIESSALPKHVTDSRSDRWLFIVAFLLGTVGILAARVANLHNAIPVSIGIAALVVYAIFAWRSPLYRLREDRAGDGAYYLGFLFTLVSLSYALWEFGSETRDVDLIIRNFAIAISTTIAGLVLRVMFQQMREDLDDVEEQARLSLTDSAQRLKTELLSAIEDMSIFRTRVRQEVQDDFGTSVKAITKEIVSALREAVADQAKYLDETRKQLDEHTQLSREQASGFRNASSRLAKSIEGLVERIDRIEVPSAGVKAKLAELVRVLDEQILSERDRSEKHRQVSAAAMEVLSQVTAVAKELHEAVRVSQSAAALLRESVTQAEGAATRFSQQIVNAGDAADKFTEAQAAHLERLVGAAKESLKKVESIEQQLGQAVQRSVGAVNTVHTELISAATALERGLNARRR